MPTRTKDPTKEVAKVREQIVALQHEREQLEHAPISKSEARDRVEAFVTTCATRWRPNLGPFVNASDRADTFELVPGQFRGHLHDGHALADDRAAVAVALCRFAPTLVKSQLLKAVDAHIGESGISAEARAERLAAIDGELDALEISEEQLIRTAEAQGLELPRRADARPELVLGDLDPEQEAA